MSKYNYKISHRQTDTHTHTIKTNTPKTHTIKTKQMRNTTKKIQDPNQIHKKLICKYITNIFDTCENISHKNVKMKNTQETISKKYN